jgi:hypothetical protein
MIPNTFIVDNFDELLTLQRVFREAKFCAEPDDAEVSDSPIVAKMFERLMTTLIARDVMRDGESARQRWMDWLAIDESRDEWHAAVRRARANDRWATFSDEERNSYIQLILSPFVVSPEISERFVRMVNEPQE